MRLTMAVCVSQTDPVKVEEALKANMLFARRCLTTALPNSKRATGAPGSSSDEVSEATVDNMTAGGFFQWMGRDPTGRPTVIPPHRETASPGGSPAASPAAGTSASRAVSPTSVDSDS